MILGSHAPQELENNHLLKPNSIELTIGQVCLLGRAPAGRSSNKSKREGGKCQNSMIIRGGGRVW